MTHTHTMSLTPPTTVAELAGRLAEFQVNLRALQRGIADINIDEQPEYASSCGLADYLSRALRADDGDHTTLRRQIEDVIERVGADPNANGRFMHVEYTERRLEFGYSMDATSEFQFAAFIVALLDSVLQKAQADFEAASQQS